MRFEKTHRPEIVEPQLAAMVDVFSMLVIFLIAGTVMGTTAVVLPAGLVPPKSISKESMLTAPQLTVEGEQVRLSFSSSPFSLKAFLPGGDLAEINRFKGEVQNFLEKNKARPDTESINLVADRGLTYQHLFAVIKVAREAGIKSILFISQSEAARD